MKRLHYFRDAKKIGAALTKVDHVVVNVVERSFPMRFEGKVMGWSSPLGKDVLRRNKLAASRCSWSKAHNWLEE